MIRDVNNNTALTNLYCENTNIAELDVSNNAALNDLFCFNKSDGVTMTVQGIVSGYTEENPQIVYEYACGEIRGAEQLLTVALNLTVNQPPTITAENITVTVEKEVDTNHPGNEQKPSDDGKTDKGQHKSF